MVQVYVMNVFTDGAKMKLYKCPTQLSFSIRQNVDKQNAYPESMASAIAKL